MGAFRLTIGQHSSFTLGVHGVAHPLQCVHSAAYAEYAIDMSYAFRTNRVGASPLGQKEITKMGLRFDFIIQSEGTAVRFTALSRSQSALQLLLDTKVGLSVDNDLIVKLPEEVQQLIDAIEAAGLVTMTIC